MSDKLILCGLLFAAGVGAFYLAHLAESSRMPRQAAWFVLLSWPLSFAVSKATRGRLSWFEQCTPLCAEALRLRGRTLYVSVPIAIAGMLAIIVVVIAAPDLESKLVLAALTIVGLVGGALHALAWDTNTLARKPYRWRASLPSSEGLNLFILCTMRTQLHGLRPSLPLFVSLASGIFCLVAGTVLLSDTQHVALFAAAVTAVPLIALSRSDYPLSRCAPSIGFSARWVLIAHGLIPLGVAVVASAAVFLLRGFDAVALSMMWGAWGLFSTIAALRSLRYPRFSKHSADLRLVGDVVVLAMLGITFLPLVLPGAVALIYQAARAHRRLIWIVS